MAVDSPFPGYIEDAKAGALTVRMDPQGFIDIDKACQELINQLTGIRADARDLGEKTSWGLGESNPRLSSAVELVQLFREKAFGGPNNAYDTLSDYVTVAEEIRAMFKTICETYQRTDAEFAAKLREISA
ncbi:hypothetical protein NONI108955_29905 [Nocardia ninae]|uniref:PE domain-containing protein n=1 Tax=Nocardia ninae NBRC 108245 TaxID=1210091 RepID=A0A511MIJ1_9NOCA|nr:hypothetical protein [Nocardia ninae]GEM39736.1 hypothetical protein NN4_42550 [Nocardia ninae NBRC 108245]